MCARDSENPKEMDFSTGALNDLMRRVECNFYLILRDKILKLLLTAKKFFLLWK